MVNKDHNILIICHGFPPSPGVAGRRWAKFSKYLHHNGYNVYVLASENVKEEESEWKDDINGINVEYLPYRFPKIVNVNKNGFFDKIKYRLWLFILKVVNKGNFYDRTFFWKSQITSKVSEYIKTKSINTVIVTAGPFMLSYYVTTLKSKYPHVKFIVDFRDLWTGDTEITSFSSLSKKRVERERFYEKMTIIQSDYILTVGEKMSQYFSSLAVNKNVFTLPNGYDEDDFKDIQIKEQESDNLIRLVFAGTFYINLTYIIIPFFEALDRLRNENPKLFDRLRIMFYGTFPEPYKDLVKKYDLNSIIQVNKNVPLKEIYSKIKQASACLLFLNDVYNFALSTKFCEYISQNKKIIVVSNKGPTAEFITENNLGYWISPTNAYNDIVACLSNLESPADFMVKSDFDVSYYSISNLTNILMKVIDSTDYSKVEQKKNILFTFDYELFLGAKSGLVMDCIILPTEKILAVFQKYNIKHALFFVDTIYIKRLEENLKQDPFLKNDYNLIVSQLIKILEQGHYIFPHIHPHWLDATYESKTKQWNLGKVDNYRLHNLPFLLQQDLFEYSINLIKRIQYSCNIDYPIDAYRAGGWCIQPFSEFKPHFEKYGLKYDFSVLRDFKMLNSKFYYNFTDFPKKSIYKFESNIEQESVSGSFTEFCITSINFSEQQKVINSVFLKVLYKLNYLNSGVGLSVKKTEDHHFIEDLDVMNNLEMTSFELLTITKMEIYKKYTDANSFIHFITHPKMLTQHNLFCFDRYLNFISTKYPLETHYKNVTGSREVN